MQELYIENERHLRLGLALQASLALAYLVMPGVLERLIEQVLHLLKAAGNMESMFCKAKLRLQHDKNSHGQFFADQATLTGQTNHQDYRSILFTGLAI